MKVNLRKAFHAVKEEHVSGHLHTITAPLLSLSRDASIDAHLMTTTKTFAFSFITSCCHQCIEGYIFYPIVGLHLPPTFPLATISHNIRESILENIIASTMKLSSIFSMVISLTSASATFLKGFSFAPYNRDGSCKNSSDRMQAFNYMAALSGNFTSARLTATSECSALANAVPSALQHSISLLVGVVAETDDMYNAEKVALISTLKEHEKDSFDWLMGVHVGLEDVVFNSANISHLVAQIFDVRGNIEAGMVRLIYQESLMRATSSVWILTLTLTTETLSPQMPLSGRRSTPCRPLGRTNPYG